AIAGYAELLRMGVRGPVNPAQMEDLDRILRSERTLLAIINDILNFARVEAGSITINTKDIPVHELLQGSETFVAPQLHAKHITFAYTPADPALVMQGDPDKVRQILLNLLTNAAKFTASGGRIAPDAPADDGRVYVAGRDP